MKFGKSAVLNSDGNLFLLFKKRKMSEITFLGFLKQSDVLKLGVTFMMSSQINIFVGEFVNTIVSPIIARIFKKNEKTLEEIKFKRFGVEFQLAKLLSATIRLIIVVSIIFFLVKSLVDVNVELYKPK